MAFAYTPQLRLLPAPYLGGRAVFSHGHETYLFRFSVSRAHGIPGNRILSVSVRDRWLFGQPAEPPARRPVFPIRDLGGGTSAGIADRRARVTTRAAALEACVSTVHRSPAAAGTHLNQVEFWGLPPKAMMRGLNS